MNVQDIVKYSKIIRKWWWVIVLLFGATVGTMVTIAFFTETQYKALVTVQVSAPPPQEVPLYSQFGRGALNDEIAQTQASFSELILEGDVPQYVLQALPEIPFERSELRERTEIEIPENSHLMRISVRAPTSEQAALLANTVVEVGLQRYGELLARPTASTRQFIERELELARKELTDAEAGLSQFQIDNKIGTLGDAINTQYELMRSLRIQRDLIRADGEVVKAQTLEEIILEREAELQNLIGLSAEYNVLADRVERARAAYDFLLDKRAEAQIKENQILELASIQVITPAHPPKAPVAAIDAKLIVLGAVVSILAGGLLTFFLEYMEISGAFRIRQDEAVKTDMTIALPHEAK